MNIGILETGHPPAELEPRFGSYPAMFRELLGEAFTGHAYDVTTGQFPERMAAHDGYLVTGSPAGVYDPLPWIDPLKAFLRAAKGNAKLVGVCFGHQVMAEAFGGEVRKSERGWGVGLHRYDITQRMAWMNGEQAIAVPASHQDQVVVQPPATTVVAASPFTPFAALAYQDQPAISFQFHPEFAPEFAKALIETRRDRLPDPDAALATLDRPNDSDVVAGWIRDFLRT